MKKLNLFLLVISFIFFADLLLFTGCQNVAKENANKVDDMIAGEDNQKPLPKNLKDEDIIFYNIFTPSDMSNLINEYSSFYRSTLINSLNNITKYNQSKSAAINLGIYGADLNYLWVFDQSQQAVSYISAIQMLADQLGIPHDYVYLTIERAEQNSNNIDSLKSIARTAYKDINKYLKDNNRPNSAVLILLGGWVETLYIAINMYSEPDAKMVSRIATQKFSLNIVINLLQNQQDDLAVAEYLILLRKLHVAFDDFEIKVSKENLFIDTVNKRITIKSDKNTKFDADKINEIRLVTNSIRARMVE
jgi:hypothetical protein